MKWPQAIAALTGWKRNGTAFLFGVCATLTLAPFHLFPFIVPAYGGLFLLVDRAPSPARAFADGWWWGWGFYMTGLYWFCIALLTDAEKFAWLIPFALFGLTAVIALYQGLACGLYARLRGQAPASTRVVLFALIWVLIELIRSHALSGFPWNLAGYTFGFSDISIQLARPLGIYGLTFFTVLLGCSLAGGKRCAVAAWLLLAVGCAWGGWRLHRADSIPAAERHVPGVMLRIVQANIAQPHKWDPARQMQGMREHVRLMQSSGFTGITHIIWPETAVPYALEVGGPLTQMLGESLKPGQFLITGALRAEGAGDGWRVWNAMIALNHEGSMVGAYDKTRLVPFGEFLPLRSFFPESWLTPVGMQDMERGASHTALELPGLPPYIPLICYEAIFPRMAATAGGEWLLNITNDAWFGLSTGPYQHFDMARMRAVEQGIPLVRAANTGISGVIDGYGRVEALLPLRTQGVLDAPLPRPANY